MKKLSISDLDDLKIGSMVLGSGGGGNPIYDAAMTKQAFEEYGPASLVNLADISDDALVAPLAFMGAPLISIERIPSGNELTTLLNMIKEAFKRPVTHLLAAEIGGANAFTPLIASAKTGLPVIDGDTLGRAFPELQMSSCNLRGISPSPCFMTDCMQNKAIVYGKTGADMERFCRKIAVEMGSSAAISLYLMTGKECKESIIAGTMTQAMNIGKAMRSNPIKGLVEYTKGIKIGSGIITDIDQSIKDGFLTGSFTVTGTSDMVRVYYQNEYLMLYKNGKAVAATPDIIIPLEMESGLPITSESLMYGLRVVLVAIKGPEIWKSPKGLSFVGPEYFGYSDIEEEVSCLKNM